MGISRLESWVDSLTEDQMRPILIKLIEYLIETDDVRFPEGCSQPYWESCGDGLDGEPTWENE